MACKKQGVLFSGTKEQEAALKEVISELKLLLMQIGRAPV